MAGYESAQAEVAACTRHYVQVLGLPGHVADYMDAIAPAAWDAFPPHSAYHDPARFAEILAFHAIKAAGLPFDQAAFRKASLCGDVPVAHRRWLLRYQQHFPPALRVACREPPAEAWLARMPPAPAIDAARAIIAAGEGGIGRLRPRMQAGAAVVAAWKRLGCKPGAAASLSRLLEPAGIGLAAAYNAARHAGLVPAKASATRPPARVDRASAGGAVIA